MKPPPFEYLAPATLDEALELLEQHGDEARPLAGGQSLVPAMNFRLARPTVLIDLNRIAELAYVGEQDGGVRFGAMTRQRTLERSAVVTRHAPLIHEAMPYVAHPQIRNRGTVGGSLAHADPAAELPAVALACDARFRIRSHDDQRHVSADRFFVALFETALESHELLTEISFPALPPKTGTAFLEVSRRHGDYALVGVAVQLTLDDHGRCADARIALLSVGEMPILATAARDVLREEAPSLELFREAAETAAAKDIDPSSDLHASAAYRRHLARVLVERCLAKAHSRSLVSDRE